jgi:hypothetical protein
MEIIFDTPTDNPSHYERVIFKEDIATKMDHTKQTAFHYMNHLEGWCTRNKASILIDLVFMLRPQTIVEVGVWGGKSLIPMAYALKVIEQGKIYGIDPWNSDASVDGMEGANYDWWEKVDHNFILHGLIDKIMEYQLYDQISLIRSTSYNAPPIANIDILHIDGNHSEKSSMIDVNKWVPLVRKSGMIILDDLDWITNDKAVKWLDTHCIRLVVFKETNEWGIWIKP